jgi:ribonuclease HI
MSDKGEKKLKIKIIEQSNILYSDGAHNKETGTEAWGSVVDSNKKDILSKHKDLFKDMQLKEIKALIKPIDRIACISCFNDVKQQQNNGAELLALVCALRIATSTEELEFVEIRLDSDVVFKWWSIGNIGKKTKKTMDPKKIAYIEECTQLRKKFEEKGGKLTKIDGKDNLADLGYHK